MINHEMFKKIFFYFSVKYTENIHPKKSCCFSGLLRGDPVSDGDRHSGSPYPPNPSVVPEGHLPSRICPQRPGPDEGQVSRVHITIKTYQYVRRTVQCFIFAEE